MNDNDLKWCTRLALVLLTFACFLIGAFTAYAIVDRINPGRVVETHLFVK